MSNRCFISCPFFCFGDVTRCQNKYPNAILIRNGTLMLSAEEWAKRGTRIPWLEWGEDILPTNIQILQQFGQVCRRWHEPEGEEENSSLVTTKTITTIYHILYSSGNSVIVLYRCDRILWYGRGLSQLSYVRGESRFSDHRPVYSMFSAEVESINHRRIQKMNSWSSQLDMEELLPYSYGYTDINPYGYTDLNFYWNG